MAHQSRFDVTSLGEVLLRFAVGPGTRLAEARSLDLKVAGAEMNTCAALASLGRKTGLLTALPNNDVAQLPLRRLRELAIDTEAVRLEPDSRIGTYYVELAGAPRTVKVTYDRMNSAASRMALKATDWEYLLDTRLLHLTGITPALSDTCRELVEAALERAQSANVPVSFDINYRSNLWPASDAGNWCDAHIREVEILCCAERDARNLFGLGGTAEEVADGLYESLRPKALVLTLGDEGALLYENGEVQRQSAVPALIVDRLGAGDALAAGLIDGWLDDSLRAGMERGVILAALALSQVGDQVITNRAEVESLAAASMTPGGIAR
ncbi:MAG: sugar kinase [Trueperaceae bacterium]